MADDWQFALFRLYDGNKEEYPIPITVGQLLDGNKHQTAPYNRDVETLSFKQKSDRLFGMMTSQPVQNMIRKRCVYRTRGPAFGRDRPEFFLFDGNHRMNLLHEFVNGTCYVKLYSETDRCEYYAWATQEAVDNTDHEKLGYSKKYAIVLAHEFMSRLMECPISMIELNKDMSDIDAYQRARVANECKPLQNSGLIKCMVSMQTKMAGLLRDMSIVCGKVFDFLRDDIYTCNGSVLIIACAHSFDNNFYNYIVKIKNLNKLDEILRSTDLDNDTAFCTTLLEVKQTTETKLNKALDNINPPLKKTDNSHKSTVSLFYIALFLAELNIKSKSINEDFVTDENVLQMMEDYIKLESYEKGDNHKRLYHFFRNGVFPPQSKKRARDDTNQSTALF
jgi:hypothetical protein